MVSRRAIRVERPGRTTIGVDEDVGVGEVDGGLQRVVGHARVEHERPRWPCSCSSNRPEEARAVDVEAELVPGMFGKVAAPVGDEEGLVVLEDELGEVGGDLEARM